MSKTRKVFRDALDARKPSEREASEDLARILSRVSRTRERAAFRYAPFAAAASFAIAATVALVLRPAPGPYVPIDRTSTTHQEPNGDADPNAITVYVRKSGEPESAALSLTVSNHEGM